MSLVKLKSTKGFDIYVSQSFVIAPLQTIGQSSLTILPTGLTMEISETASEVATKFGYQESLEV